MSGPNYLHELNSNNLALLLGHVSALRTVVKLFYEELEKNKLLPDVGEFSNQAADEIKKSMSDAAKKYSVFRHVNNNRECLALSTYHNEVSRILQGRFDS